MGQNVSKNAPSVQEFDYPLVIRIETTMPDERPIHLSGNFNDWQLGSADLIREEQADGSVQFTIPAGRSIPVPLEYKFMKGDWSNSSP
ncbi:MAG: hypothetical protein AAGH79_04515, partial [Bacteroidota bacterium]